MPLLLHLNGPPRVGKSTLARRYAEDHPGTLRLDLDVLAGLVGGWAEDFAGALEVAGEHGRVIAARHLRAGHDVVLPQLVTSHDTAPGFEQVAADAGASYVEVVLLVDDAEHARRLAGQVPANEVEHRVRELLEDPDADLVGRIRGHLAEHLAGRPGAVRVDTTGLGPEQTYLSVLAALPA